MFHSLCCMQVSNVCCMKIKVPVTLFNDLCSNASTPTVICLVSRKEICSDASYVCVLQMLMFDFTHHNIEMACALLETCGRFLYRSPDSHYRTKVYLVGVFIACLSCYHIKSYLVGVCFSPDSLSYQIYLVGVFTTRLTLTLVPRSTW